MNRRKLFSKCFSGIVLAASLGVAGQSALAAGELRYLGWSDYVHESWVKLFEEEHDVVVTGTYVGSNDEYMAKLAAGGGAYYDVVTIVSSLVQPSIKAGFIEPLDLEMVPNFYKIFPDFQNIDLMRGPNGEVYGAPWMWGTNPVTVNADIYPEGNDFGILFDPKHKGKIAMWDDTSTLGDVANWMGYENIWDLTDEQLATMKDKMCEQKKLVRKYWSTPGEAIGMFASGEIVASNSYNYVTTELQSQGHNVREFVPEPPIGWIDTNFVVKGAKNRELAHKFINFLLDAKILAMAAEHLGYSVSNPDAKAHMNPAVWEKLYMDEGPRLLTTMKIWAEIPRREKYIEVWNEIKACP